MESFELDESSEFLEVESLVEVLDLDEVESLIEVLDLDGLPGVFEAESSVSGEVPESDSCGL